MAQRLPPVWWIIKYGRSWPGIIRPAPWEGNPAPDGWEFVYGPNNILSYANDGSPYITDGSEVISLYQYEARNEPPDPPPYTIVIYDGMAVSYDDEPITTYVSYPEGGYGN